ncbi:MAG: RNA 2',3'-cyclic phosphodiesterase [Kiritimatiellia bacterium]
MIRSFAAVEIGDGVRQGVAEFQAHLKRVAGDAKWVDPESFHLTLVFYGEIPEETVTALSAVLDKVAAGFHPFECSVVGAGFFGSPKAPRVLWVGIAEGGERLAALQTTLAQESRQIGLVIETRPFAPHLTIARFRIPRAAACLASQLKRWEEHDFGRFRVDRIVLFRSDLTPKGAVYSRLHEALLPASTK